MKIQHQLKASHSAVEVIKLNQAVKTIFFVLLCVFLCACQSVRHSMMINTKHGSYTVNIKNAQSSNEPLIYGEIYDFDTHLSLQFSKVQINGKQMYSTDNGLFKFKLEPGKYRFTGKAFPYEFCETKTIVLNRGDSVELNIYLKPYKKPIVD